MKRTRASVVIGLMGLSLAALPPQASAQAVETEHETRTIEVPGTTVTFELVRVPGGVVEVDGESHEVPDLWVLPHEVTWDLYDVFLYELDKPESERESVGKGADAVTRPSKPYVPPDRGLGHEGYPAMGMTLHAARRFSEWLGEHTGVASRLPTKAEWVHLASAEGGGVWSKENAEFTTRPVGSLEPNGSVCTTHSATSPSGWRRTRSAPSRWAAATSSPPRSARRRRRRSRPRAGTRATRRFPRASGGSPTAVGLGSALSWI